MEGLVSQFWVANEKIFSENETLIKNTDNEEQNKRNLYLGYNEANGLYYAMDTTGKKLPLYFYNGSPSKTSIQKNNEIDTTKNNWVTINKKIGKNSSGEIVDLTNNYTFPLEIKDSDGNLLNNDYTVLYEGGRYPMFYNNEPINKIYVDKIWVHNNALVRAERNVDNYGQLSKQIFLRRNKIFPTLTQEDHCYFPVYLYKWDNKLCYPVATGNLMPKEIKTFQDEILPYPRPNQFGENIEEYSEEDKKYLWVSANIHSVGISATSLHKRQIESNYKISEYLHLHLI